MKFIGYAWFASEPIVLESLVSEPISSESLLSESIFLRNPSFQNPGLFGIHLIGIHLFLEYILWSPFFLDLFWNPVVSESISSVFISAAGQ